MEVVMKYLRMDEWMSSKVTMMLGILAYFVCIEQKDFSVACKELFVYFLFLSMFLSISYVSNDFSDMEIDRMAGKKKVIGNIPKKVIWLSLICMGFIGDIPILLYVEDKMLGVVLIILTTFLGVAYSVPGIRFKERGIWGLLECSFAQHCMPLIVLLLFLEMNKENIFLWMIWFVLSFFDGLRYILIHQFIDRENDRATGTHTFVSDRQMNIRKCILYLCVLEIACCILLMMPLFSKYRVIIIIGFVFNFFLEFCIYEVLNVYAKKDWLVSYDSVPLEAFLNIIMPVMFSICMAGENAWALLFCVFILICCFKSLKVKLGIATVYLRSKVS